MRKRKSPREHRPLGGVARNKKSDSHGPTFRGWVVRAAKIVLLAILFLYVMMGLDQLPVKYQAYGLVPALLAAAVLAFCIFENVHHICDGVNEVLRLASKVVCSAGQVVLEGGMALLRAGEKLMKAGEYLRQFGENVHHKIEHWLQGKR